MKSFISLNATDRIYPQLICSFERNFNMPASIYLLQLRLPKSDCFDLKFCGMDFFFICNKLIYNEIENFLKKSVFFRCVFA